MKVDYPIGQIAQQMEIPIGVPIIRGKLLANCYRQRRVLYTLPLIEITRGFHAGLKALLGSAIVMVIRHTMFMGI